MGNSKSIYNVICTLCPNMVKLSDNNTECSHFHIIFEDDYVAITCKKDNITKCYKLKDSLFSRNSKTVYLFAIKSWVIPIDYSHNESNYALATCCDRCNNECVIIKDTDKNYTRTTVNNTLFSKIFPRMCYVCKGNKTLLVPNGNFNKCNTCDSTGGIKCTECQGIGRRTYGGYRYQQNCKACDGIGYLHRCKVCNGSGSMALYNKIPCHLCTKKDITQEFWSNATNSELNISTKLSNNF